MSCPILQIGSFVNPGNNSIITEWLAGLHIFSFLYHNAGTLDNGGPPAQEQHGGGN